MSPLDNDKDLSAVEQYEQLLKSRRLSFDEIEKRLDKLEEFVEKQTAFGETMRRLEKAPIEQDQYEQGTFI